MPAPIRPNTAAANEATRRRGDETAARRLRDRGWLVLEPDLTAPSFARGTLDDLLDVPVTMAVNWLMATFARQRTGGDLPRLNWTRFVDGGNRTERLRGWASSRGPAVFADLDPWVEAFGMQRKPSEHGDVKFVGEIDGIPIEVWGLEDETAYVSRRRGRRAGQ
jgi:hypothetical protein